MKTTVSTRKLTSNPTTTEKEIERQNKLCQQVARTINLCLNDCDDPIVQSMLLMGVQPAPDSSCLMLHLECDVDEFDHGNALLAIQNQTARLQFEISRSIHRKRVPSLTYSVRAIGGQGSE